MKNSKIYLLLLLLISFTKELKASIYPATTKSSIVKKELQDLQKISDNKIIYSEELAEIYVDDELDKKLREDGTLETVLAKIGESCIGGGRGAKK